MKRTAMKRTAVFKLNLFVAFVCCTALIVVYWDHPAVLTSKQAITQLFKQKKDQVLQYSSSGFGHLAPEPGQTTIYKIQNPDGSWTYTNQTPSTSDRASKKTYDPNTNVIAAGKPTTPKPATAANSQPDSNINALTPYSNPGQVLELIENAKNVQQKLNERNLQMNQQIEQ